MGYPASTKFTLSEEKRFAALTVEDADVQLVWWWTRIPHAVRRQLRVWIVAKVLHSGRAADIPVVVDPIGPHELSPLAEALRATPFEGQARTRCTIIAHSCSYNSAPIIALYDDQFTSTRRRLSSRASSTAEPTWTGGFRPMRARRAT